MSRPMDDLKVAIEMTNAPIGPFWLTILDLFLQGYPCENVANLKGLRMTLRNQEAKNAFKYWSNNWSILVIALVIRYKVASF